MGYFLQVKSQPMINLQLKHMCMKTVKMQSSNHHDAKCPILKTKETDIGIIKLQMCKNVKTCKNVVEEVLPLKYPYDHICRKFLSHILFLQEEQFPTCTV